jgi:hypothetical protein
MGPFFSSACADAFFAVTCYVWWSFVSNEYIKIDPDVTHSVLELTPWFDDYLSNVDMHELVNLIIFL